MNFKRAFIAVVATMALPLGAYAQSNFPAQVNFFPNTGDQTADVTLTCNGGVPLTQTQQDMADQEMVTFVVVGTDADTDCEITGSEVAGFSINYGNYCSFTNIGEDFRPLGMCTLDYEADDVSFTVSKVWDLAGAGGDLVDPSYSITIMCSEEITDTSPAADNDWSYGDYYYASWDLSGTAGGTFSVDVDAQGATPSCSASEDIAESAVESDSNCGSRSIAIGSSSSCTITNTVFFEGIPTLSQYGLAIMALLMLGVGFVGLRRFA